MNCLKKKNRSVHHRSVVTTPLTSFSVHPVEKFIELLFFPVALCIVPISGGTLLLFLVVSTLINIFGHAGFEFKWLFFKRPDPIAATAVFHEMHHMYPNRNFSLYFIIWDRLLRTEHKKYDQLFSSHMKSS